MRVKSVRIWSFLPRIFPYLFRIWTKYADLFRKSPYSVRKQKNTDQKNSEYGHFFMQ